MLYLILAICCNAMISIVMRVSKIYTQNQMPMLAMNYVTCCLLAALYAGPGQLLPVQAAGFGTALWVGALSGLLYLTSFVLLHWNIRQNGVVLPATFMRLGVLVPAVLAVVLFREAPRACASSSALPGPWPPSACCTLTAPAARRKIAGASSPCCWPGALPMSWPRSMPITARRR